MAQKLVFSDNLIFIKGRNVNCIRSFTVHTLPGISCRPRPQMGRTFLRDRTRWGSDSLILLLVHSSFLLRARVLSVAKPRTGTSQVAPEKHHCKYGYWIKFRIMRVQYVLVVLLLVCCTRSSLVAAVERKRERLQKERKEQKKLELVRNLSLSNKINVELERSN